MIMSIWARQNIKNWPIFGCHRLHNQHIGISTIDYSNIGDLPKHLDHKFKKIMILTSKSHKLETLPLSPVVALIPNIHWTIAVTLLPI